MRRSEASALMSKGNCEPLTLVNSKAGPPLGLLTQRSAISVISKRGSTFGRDLLQFAGGAQGSDEVLKIVVHGLARFSCAAAKASLLALPGVPKAS